MKEDKDRQRLAFSAFSELKHVFLVDEDVDCFDMNDVLWAMNTRFQGDADIITIPGVRCHPLDPSNDQHVLQVSEIMGLHARQSLIVLFHMIRKSDSREQDLWKLIRNTGYHKIQNINRKRKFI